MPQIFIGPSTGHQLPEPAVCVMHAGVYTAVSHLTGVLLAGTLVELVQRVCSHHRLADLMLTFDQTCFSVRTSHVTPAHLHAMSGRLCPTASLRGVRRYFTLVPPNSVRQTLLPTPTRPAIPPLARSARDSLHRSRWCCQCHSDDKPAWNRPQVRSAQVHLLPTPLQASPGKPLPPYRQRRY